MRTARSPWPLALLLAGLSGPAFAREATLSVDRAQEASGCPDRDALAAAVRARLSYDPFVDAAPTALQVSFSRSAQEWIATVRSGASERTLRSAAADCAELAEAVALSVAVAVDPRAFAPKPPPAPAPAPAPPPEVPLRWHAYAAPLVAFNAAPAPNAGALLGVGFSRGAFLAQLEARVDLPAGIAIAGGSVATQLLGAALVPCYTYRWLGVCAAVFAGAMRVTGEGLPDAQRASAFVFSAGPRVFLDVPLHAAFSLRPSAEVAAPFTRTTITVGTATAWVTPAVTAQLHLAAIFHFE